MLHVRKLTLNTYDELILVSNHGKVSNSFINNSLHENQMITKRKLSSVSYYLLKIE